MAPKRKRGKQTPIPPSAPKRRHQAEPVAEPTIDYDRLVDTLLRPQSSFNSNTTSATEGVVNSLQSIVAGQPERLSEDAHCSGQNAPITTTSAEPPVTTTPTTTETCPPSTSSEVAVNPSIPTVLNTLFGGNLGPSALAGQTPSTNSTSPASNLSDTARTLLHSSLALSTKASYKHSWTLYLQFCHQNNLMDTLPIAEITLCNFIAHMFEQSYSPASISSTVSALSYVHKIYNLPDAAQNFMVKKILYGAHKSSKSPDYRLPITTSILERLLTALESIVPNYFNKILLQCIFSVAFHGFFRLGELIAKTPSQTPYVVQKQDVNFIPDAKVQITLRHSKTMQIPHPIIIQLTQASKQVCPVRSLQTFLSTHNHTEGPLFQNHAGSPVSYHFVTQHLQKAVSFIGLNPQFYKGHSFRIGAATEAAKRGLSQIEIQKLGRWKSDAFQKYIRINLLHP